MMEYSFDVLVVIRMNPAAEDELFIYPSFIDPYLSRFLVSPLQKIVSCLLSKEQKSSFFASPKIHKESKFPLQTKHVGRRYEQGNVPPVDAFSRL